MNQLANALDANPVRSLESFPNAFILGSDLEIDRHQHKVFVARDQIDLTPKEYALLLILARQVCECGSGAVTRETFIKELYEGKSPKSNSMEVIVNRIRTKLEKSKLVISTVRSKGYELCMRDGTEVGVYAPE